MGIFYRIKTTFKAGTRSLFVAFIKLLAAKLTKNALLVTDLKVPGTKFMTNALELEDLSLASRSHDGVSAKKAKILVAQIKSDYRADALCVEDAVNLAQDPTLAATMGFELKIPRGKVQIPELTVKNGIESGTLIIKTRKVPHYHYFLVECTQKFADGSADIITEKSMPDPKSDVLGFESGAFYLIRVRVVLAGNVKGEWTDYVQIRVN
ncbi:MAG: hypothetical protein WCL51_08190 [Bacteroidota bacterium]